MDMNAQSGKDIPIENRSEDEIKLCKCPSKTPIAAGN